jgi:predicted NBD/HSP70 family sugar kinase
MIFKGHKLTIGLDLGDRWSSYCVLDEAGEVILEQKLPTTPEAWATSEHLALAYRNNLLQICSSDCTVSQRRKTKCL